MINISSSADGTQVEVAIGEVSIWFSKKEFDSAVDDYYSENIDD